MEAYRRVALTALSPFESATELDQKCALTPDPFPFNCALEILSLVTYLVTAEYTASKAKTKTYYTVCPR